MIPTVVTGDLLDQKVEVIVNSWNRNLIPWWLLLPQGVSGAIKKRAGTAPFREVGRAGALPLGSAVLTGPGRLPQLGIIHVAGINMLWRDFLKRVIGLPGEAVEIVDGRVYVDGTPLVEPYALFEPTAGVPPQLRSFTLTFIPAGKLFVLGDNRNRSEDSRLMGLLDRDKVKARVGLIYWSKDAENGRVRWDRIGKAVH